VSHEVNFEHDLENIVMQVAGDQATFVVPLVVDLLSKLKERALASSVGAVGLNEHLASLEGLASKKRWQDEG